MDQDWQVGVAIAKCLNTIYVMLDGCSTSGNPLPMEVPPFVSKTSSRECKLIEPDSSKWRIKANAFAARTVSRILANQTPRSLPFLKLLDDSMISNLENKCDYNKKKALGLASLFFIREEPNSESLCETLFIKLSV